MNEDLNYTVLAHALFILSLFFFLQEALSNLEDYDKTCLEAALQGVSNVVQQEWGSACPCQVY